MEPITLVVTFASGAVSSVAIAQSVLRYCFVRREQTFCHRRGETSPIAQVIADAIADRIRRRP